MELRVASCGLWVVGWSQPDGGGRKGGGIGLALLVACGPASRCGYTAALLPVAIELPWVLGLAARESLRDAAVGGWGDVGDVSALPVTARVGLLRGSERHAAARAPTAIGRSLSCPRHDLRCRCATAAAPSVVSGSVVPPPPSPTKGGGGTSISGGGIPDGDVFCCWCCTASAEVSFAPCVRSGSEGNDRHRSRQRSGACARGAGWGVAVGEVADG